MKRVLVFDAAHLADAVGKAARVAPRSGPGHDKAAGFVFTSDGLTCEIKATDTEISYWQTIPCVDSKEVGDGIKWRMPSGVVTNLVKSLSLDSGLKVQFIDTGDSWLRIKAGRTTAKIPMIPIDTYPIIPPVGRDGMLEANDFASKIAQVSWATAKVEVLAGVHLDGESIIACDKFTVAMVPCKLDLVKPITVQINGLVPLVKSATDVKLRATTRLEMLLDAETQAACSIIMDPYPDVRQIKKIADGTFLNSVTFSKLTFLETMERMLTVVAGEKMPTVVITFDALTNGMTLDIDEPDHGRVQEWIDCVYSPGFEAGMAPHDQANVISATPLYLKGAIDACKSGKVCLEFGDTDRSKHRRKVFRITDESEYEAYVMPRVKSEKESS